MLINICQFLLMFHTVGCLASPTSSPSLFFSYLQYAKSYSAVRGIVGGGQHPHTFIWNDPLWQFLLMFHIVECLASPPLCLPLQFLGLHLWAQYCSLWSIETSNWFLIACYLEVMCGCLLLFNCTWGIRSHLGFSLANAHLFIVGV